MGLNLTKAARALATAGYGTTLEDGRLKIFFTQAQATFPVYAGLH